MKLSTRYGCTRRLRELRKAQVQNMNWAGDTRPNHGVELTDGSRTFVYGRKDPFRSWPSSANELVEVTMGSETNV